VAADSAGVCQGPGIQGHALEASFHSSDVDALPCHRTCEYHADSLRPPDMTLQATGSQPAAAQHL